MEVDRPPVAAPRAAQHLVDAQVLPPCHGGRDREEVAAVVAEGLLTALFLEFTAAAFAVMLAACLAHEATTWADLAYAEPRRRIPWYEQVVHALQQAIPWVGLLLLMLAHAPQALALFAIGPEPPDWSLRPKADPLPTRYVAVFLGASLLCVGAPFVEELRRCRRASADRRV